MNIFKILTRGDGKINEPSVTAFLGYILNPKEDHNIGVEFLNLFISNLVIGEEDYFNDINELSLFDIDVSIERKYPLKNKNTRDIDIVVEIKEKDDEKNKIIYVIAIENKINDKSTTNGQLKEQYEALKRFYTDENTKISQVYLTPNKNNSIDSFNTYKNTLDVNIFLKQVFWKSESKDIVSLLQQLIKLENEAKIEPINEYMKHTLKSFVNFIDTDFKSKKEKQKINSQEISDVEYFSIHDSGNLKKLHDKIVTLYIPYKIKYTNNRVTYYLNNIKTRDNHFFAIYKDGNQPYKARFHSDKKLISKSYKGEFSEKENKYRLTIDDFNNIDSIMDTLEESYNYLKNDDN
ncbi:MAG: hypothetical protein U9R37_03670 [Campylobacterota bacterium]|nr:hypothetical protein [Campylobacterota bacterium]